MDFVAHKFPAKFKIINFWTVAKIIIPQSELRFPQISHKT